LGVVILSLIGDMTTALADEQIAHSITIITTNVSFETFIVL
jgi:hypothetical protein